MPLNNQPTEKWTNDNTLDVVHVWRTIQGEGPHAGLPAVFVRLAGCNLKCPLCDTNYTQGRQMMTVPQVVDAIDKLIPTEPENGLIVLSGGEPLRQNIGPLILALLNGPPTRWVQIETNGTYFRNDLPWQNPRLSVVCSPKTPAVNRDLIPHVDAWKYIIEHDYVDEVDGLPTSVLGTAMRPFRADYARRFNPHTILVQPADTGHEGYNKQNLDAAIGSCLAHGYRLSVQVQKVIGWD